MDNLNTTLTTREQSQSVFISSSNQLNTIDITYTLNNSNFSFKESPFIFIDENKAVRNLSQSFYNFQNEININKTITTIFNIESLYNIKNNIDIQLRMFQTINEIFKNFAKKDLKYIEQNINHNPLSVDIHVYINLPVTNLIFDYLNFKILENRNTISNKFEYLLFNFFSEFNFSDYPEYLNKFTALFITNFMAQAIVNDLIKLFLDEKSNIFGKININKKFQLDFYFPNYFKNTRNFGIPDQFVSEIYVDYITEQVREHIQEIFLCYLKMLDFEKILNDSYLKNNLNRFNKIKSIINIIDTIDFQINPNLNIIITFDKFKKYLKNNQSKISFKRKRI